MNKCKTLNEKAIFREIRMIKPQNHLDRLIAMKETVKWCKLP